MCGCETLACTNPTAPKILICREHRGKGKLSTHVCIYLFISLFCQLHKTVHLGGKKKKKSLLAAVC